MVKSGSHEYFENIRQWSQTFLRSTDGAVAVMYAISFAALVAITALAYDIARVHYARAHLNGTIDAIAIAIGAELKNTAVDITTNSVGNTDYEQKLIRIAKSYVIANIGSETSGFLDIGASDVTVAIKYAGTLDAPNVAQITGSVDFPLTLASSFFNLDKTEARANATVQREVRGMELALALDTSGSMDGSKMTTLKSAVSSLLDILYAGRSTIPDFYVSVVPFADDSVNVTGYSAWLSNPLSPNPYPEVECAENRNDRRYDNGSDAEENPDESLFYRGDTCSYEYTDWICVKWRRGRCKQWESETYLTWSRSPVLPLTAEKSIINDLVQDIEPNGSTSTNVGLAWAWRTLSPNWSTDWDIDANPDDEFADLRPVPYDHDVIDKTIIFMTDGANTNTGDDADDKDDWYEETCAAVKAQGVEVFTIAFQMSSSDEGIYRECASTEDHFFSADSNSDLQNAFDAIAGRLSRMKLVQ